MVDSVVPGELKQAVCGDYLAESDTSSDNTDASSSSDGTSSDEDDEDANSDEEFVTPQDALHA